MNISALVLAAGRSSRTPGRHKLLLRLNDKPIITHVVDNLLRADFLEIIVVLGHEAERVQAALASRPVRFVVNRDYAQGLSTSIKAGLAAVSSQTQALLLALGDMPLVDANDIARLTTSFARAQHATIAVPVCEGRRGNPVLFDIRYRSAMLQLAGDVGCKTIIQQNANEVLEVEMPNDHVLRDVDTLETYEKLIAISV